ncbi:EH domain-containing protein 1-like [Periplaneta americana]|uniref:EH domain-containing protein 1-like n=1 Tax=Periplaneta americana TaxID=6978 RepID=UPI0037E77F38
MLWKTLICKPRSTCFVHQRYLRWLVGGRKEPEVFSSVVDGLKTVYRNKLLPLEETYLFHDFHSPKLNDADFDSKPIILFMGQYSTGKTTLIKYLLESEFPGMRIGPEPTTDRFIAIMHGDSEGVIPGNALVVDPKKQFRPLSKFGNAFLNRFQCSTVNSSVLKSVSVIDTPGILSGEKQRIDRGYDFTGVLQWFAERVDRIVLLFDAHKLDISDEFRRSIEALHGHDDKIRIVLNKADMVDHQQLMRVYGALMWSLGKILMTPEVARVYIGSFWDQPLRNDINRRLFEDEEQDLFRDIQSLPRNAALRKLNDLIKRARLAKAHAYIISTLYEEMPTLFGKDIKKIELISNLDKIYTQLERKYLISPGDFPELRKMQEQLVHHDFKKFSSLKPYLLQTVDNMLASDIARLMAMIPEEAASTDSLVEGGAFDSIGNTLSPFGYKRGEGADAGAGDLEWIINKKRGEYDAIFQTLSPVEGKVMRTDVKTEMMKSKLPNSVLGKIYKLADVDQDGLLDADEFALMMYLISVKLEGYDLPSALPTHLIPPSKRRRVDSSASISEQCSDIITS